MLSGIERSRRKTSLLYALLPTFSFFFFMDAGLEFGGNILALHTQKSPNFVSCFTLLNRVTYYRHSYSR